MCLLSVRACGILPRAIPDRRMAREHFFNSESADLLMTVDKAAHRSGVSRQQEFPGDVSRQRDLPFRSPKSTWFALFWPGQ